ncbi:hypothetical protein RI367_002496 [Sorochytrium milnesiophthora]
MATALRTLSSRLVQCTRQRALSTGTSRKWTEEALADGEALLEEYAVPGKFRKYFKPSKRDLRKAQREAELEDQLRLTAQLPSLGVDSTRQQQQQHRGTRHAQRLVRAVHEALYNPAWTVSIPTSSRWRVDKIAHNRRSGQVDVYWVPAARDPDELNEDGEQVSMAVVGDMDQEVEALSRAVKAKVKHMLRLRAQPAISFIKRDVALDQMLDVLAMQVELKDPDSTEAEPESNRIFLKLQ